MTDASKIVVSTRIRLARNVEGYPFPSHLKNEKQAKDVIRLVTCRFWCANAIFCKAR